MKLENWVLTGSVNALPELASRFEARMSPAEAGSRLISASGTQRFRAGLQQLLTRRDAYHAVRLTSSTHSCMEVPVPAMSIWNCTPMFSLHPWGRAALGYAWLKV